MRQPAKALSLVLCALMVVNGAIWAGEKKATEAKAELERFTNSDIGWDGTYFGLIPAPPSKKLYKLANRHPRKIAPVLVEALKDPERYAVAHVYLAIAFDVEFHSDGSHWNGLAVHLYSDRVEYDGPGNLYQQWCDDLRGRGLTTICS